MKEFDRSLKCFITTNVPEVNMLDLVNHGNSFQKLQRIIAFVIRAVQRFKLRSRSSKNTVPNRTYLTARELNDSTLLIFKMVQQSEFASEIKELSKGQMLAKANHLTSLSPFVDECGYLRVGGRLQQSILPYDAKHPILLPQKHVITRLYLAMLHLQNLHAGPQALTAIARQRVWIVQGRQLARSVVNNCIRCARARPKLAMQVMGQLPSHRVTSARPFINCGVDFCGPIWTHFKIRGKRAQKSYIAVFICFCTKAVHLEVVSDLTTDAFIGCLKRFIARRGACKNIYSDNGKNFIGTKNQITELQNIIFGAKAQQQISDHCSQRRIQFHFIPPRTPHMGGLWEAAVKSAKHLLSRTVSSAALTYEELCTVTTEVEAVLNSRPITPLSSDPNDYMALTPGHFLIGEPLSSTVDPHSSEASMSLLSRWQLVSFCKTEFWKRWSTEYLTNLQQRAKWAREYPDMMIGTLVLIKNDNLPPLQWSLGRIEAIIKGPDQHVRVADVRTPTGIIRRCIHMLAPLPVELSDDEVANEKHEENIPDDNITEYTQDTSLENMPRTRDPKRRKNNGINVATTLITILFLLPLVVASNIKIHNIEDNSGIFYDYQGEIRLIPSHWNIMVYVRLDGCQTMEHNLKTTLAHMKRTSEDIVHNSPYLETIRYFEERIVLAQQYKNVLFQSPKTLMRKRRSPMNIVGTAFNKLFGILDEDYAEEMKTTIAKVQTNEQSITNLLKNHTSILDATINVFKREQHELLEHNAQLKKLMHDNYLTFSNQLADHVKQQGAIGLFNVLSTLLSSYLLEYTQMQDVIADISFGLSQGHTSLHVISPTQLRQQLKLIREVLPSSLTLPQDKRSDLNSLYKVIAIKGTISDDYYLFKVQIPLLLGNRFKLYKILAIPTTMNDSQITITLTTEYLGADLHDNKFYALSSTDVHTCIIFSEEVHFCQQKGPIENEYAGEHQCETQSMSAQTLPKSCYFTYTHLRNWWRQLSDTGSWLYAVTSPTDVTILCSEGIPEHATIQNVGIIHLEKGCTLKTKELTVTSYNNIKSNISLAIQPRFNLTFFDMKKEVPVIPPQITFPEYRTNLQSNWTNLQNQIRDLQSTQIKLEELSPKDVHQYSIGYISLGLILSIIAIWGYQQYYKKKPIRETVNRESTNQQFELQYIQRQRRQDVEST